MPSFSQITLHDAHFCRVSLTGNVVGDVVDNFNRERELLKTFRDQLATATEQLTAADKKPNLIFFIDELDRCRPTFAIELLERIKHLFDVPNIVFVLSIDKQQLEAITGAVYGASINAPEYLRRFIDVEYGIPAVNAKRFTENLFKRFDLDSVFSRRNSPELRHDKENFIDIFTLLANAMGLSLRARERCITRLSVVMDQTPANYYLDPILVALLIVLRSNNPPLFKRLINSDASPSEVMNFLSTLPGGEALTRERYGSIIEAYLIVADPKMERRRQRETELSNAATNPSLSAPEKHLAEELVRMIGHINGGMRMGINLGQVASKIDLAAYVRD